jgi:hypothetical protein
MRSSELRLLNLPVVSGCKCPLATSKSFLFMARTMLSRSSCDPTPTCMLVGADGPQPGVGGLLDTLTWVASNGLRRRVGLSTGATSLPSAVEANPCKADQELVKKELMESLFCADLPVVDAFPEKDGVDLDTL